eukprot:gb/GECG01008611.1/.p1 GENE.gb/GECG01008611.1/~~gb/GECG01008611.1/.p1  ORF type:complete len:182 (+),score=19.52 gb/GECG01008611.1/:1-546(+)
MSHGATTSLFSHSAAELEKGSPSGKIHTAKSSIERIYETGNAYVSKTDNIPYDSHEYQKEASMPYPFSSIDTSTATSTPQMSSETYSTIFDLERVSLHDSPVDDSNVSYSEGQDHYPQENMQTTLPNHGTRWAEMFFSLSITDIADMYFPVTESSRRRLHGGETNTHPMDYIRRDSPPFTF